MESPDQQRLTALSLATALALLQQSGSSEITRERLEADLADGAPVNPDGTINLLHYTAWLVKAVARERT